MPLRDGLLSPPPPPPLFFPLFDDMGGKGIVTMVPVTPCCTRVSKTTLPCSMHST